MKFKKRIQDEILYLLLLKNNIALLIPAVLVFVVGILFVTHFPVLYRYNTNFVSNYEEMASWYDKECYNVQRTLSDLNYTGIDYYEGQTLKGAFYYTFTSDGCQFVLLDTRHPKPYYKEETVQAKMLTSSPYFESMFTEYAKLTGFDNDTIKDIALPIVLSEIDYPWTEKFILAIALILPLVVSGSIILLSGYWFWQPAMSPSCRAFKDFGDRRLVYHEVRSQFKNRMIDHWDGIYITADYLVISEWFQTHFIRMDFVQYMVCSIVKSGRKQHYRLTLSNPKKMFFEYDFDDENEVQIIVKYIEQQNPDVLNYVDQPPEGYEIAAQIHKPDEVVELYDGTKEYQMSTRKREETVEEELPEIDQSLEEELAEMARLGISPEASQSEEIVKEAN